ncbi:MAG: MFS transporter [Leptolyngbya sp. SIO4C1]|nr:MFS transporter [Leptolyngbya sp. SIO4C1]
MLSQVGIGFTLFYAPIFFVNQVGLSATAVGLGLGSQSVSGLLGRFLGGSMTDSARWGRRRTLLLSAAISALADAVFVLTNNFTVFVAGNLLMGLGVGLYWPATEAVVADITTAESRNEAFAIVRLADSLGLGLGVVLGGALIAATGAYRALFVIDGITFLLFFTVVAVAIAETRPDDDTDSDSFWAGWGTALRDRPLLTYVTVNILFTTYLSQVQSTLPVYFNRFATGSDAAGLSEAVLSGLFTWHVALTAICQLPVARLLRRMSQPRALMISAGFWALGFIGIWWAGTASTPIVIAAAALGILALATVAYTPIASALVVQLSPIELRGVYLSINSMCWAIGYLIGPPIGGWALDQSPQVAHRFWLTLAASVLIGLAILTILQKQMRSRLAKS